MYFLPYELLIPGMRYDVFDVNIASAVYLKLSLFITIFFAIYKVKTENSNFELCHFESHDFFQKEYVCAKINQFN